MLTKKQKKVLNYIDSYNKKRGYSPTLEEICRHMRIKSISNAHYYVSALERRGYLQKDARRPRAISVESHAAMNMLPRIASLESISVPILGAANAGTATLLAEENIEGRLKVPPRLATRKDTLFALRIEGDSMNRAQIDGKNIEDGDFVLIDTNYKDPKNDDYVLSIIDDCANIKKFTQDKKSGFVILIPESTNKKHKPIYISGEDNFSINGKVVAVIKK